LPDFFRFGRNDHNDVPFRSERNARDTPKMAVHQVSPSGYSHVPVVNRPLVGSADAGARAAGWMDAASRRCVEGAGCGGAFPGGEGGERYREDEGE
jgi:hypothetical protein